MPSCSADCEMLPALEPARLGGHQGSKLPIKVAMRCSMRSVGAEAIRIADYFIQLNLILIVPMERVPIAGMGI